MALTTLAFIKPALIGLAVLLTIAGCFIPWGRKGLLTYLIVAGLGWGVFVGQILFLDQAQSGPVTPEHWSKTLGDLVLIRPLMLLIVPLVFVSVVVGVTSIGDPSRLGVLGGATILFYIATMLIAATLGSLLVQTIRPGELDPEARAALTTSAADRFSASEAAARIQQVQAQSRDRDPLPQAFMQILRDMVPTNIVKAMSEGSTLGIIVFALLFGLALASGGDKCAPAVRWFNAVFDALMRLVQWVIWLTPLGVFFLMTWTVGSIGLKNLAGPISMYMLTVVLGLFTHGAIVLPFILFLFLRSNPYKYMWQMRRPLLTAFGTSSSYATLPVTIEAAENEGGCSKRAAGFVLPLGATINMDGTALYQAIAVIFLFQLYDIDLSFAQLVVVVMTATLVAVGAAGIPSAGLVLMFIVVNAVNTSLPGEENDLPLQAIGVVIGVDRVLDMCRTTVNIWGDSVGAKLISAIAPDLPEEREQALG